MQRKLDLKGERFVRLLVVEETPHRNKSGNIKWLCKCECGKEVSVSGSNLKNGHTKSCGCLSRGCLNILYMKYIGI